MRAVTLEELLEQLKRHGVKPLEESCAMKAGTRVVKVRSEPGDAHADGAKATVVRSICADGFVFGYFIVWDDTPSLCFVAAHRVALP